MCTKSELLRYDTIPNENYVEIQSIYWQKSFGFGQNLNKNILYNIIQTNLLIIITDGVIVYQMITRPIRNHR